MKHAKHKKPKSKPKMKPMMKPMHKPAERKAMILSGMMKHS